MFWIFLTWVLNIPFKTKNIQLQRSQQNLPPDPVEDINKWDKFQSTENSKLEYIVDNEYLSF